MRTAIGVAMLTLLLAAAALAQQGGGGFGGGGGGFGGGGRLMRPGDSEVTQVSQILTPGDTGEFPLTVKDGETIIVRVTSAAFDPAVAILDSAGKTLVEVDDIRPGEQDALALYRFPKATTCKIVVKGFKSKAGGLFEMTIRRFIPTDVKFAERNAGSIPRTGRQWFRFPAEAGQTVVLTVRATAFKPELSITAPNGETVAADTRHHNSARTVRSVFRADTKGDYFARLSSEEGRGDSFALTAAFARVMQTKIDSSNPAAALDAGGLDIWRFPAEAGDFLRIQAGTSVSELEANLQRFKQVDPKKNQDEPESDPSSYIMLPANPKAKGEVLALIRRAGTYEVAISQPSGRETRYSLAIGRPAKAWNAETSREKLTIGNSDYWMLEAKAGQILRFEASSEQFDPVLSLYDPNGAETEVNDDGAGAGASLLTARVTEPGRYLLRVHSFGNGGGGAYRLRRIPDPIHALNLGASNQGSVGAGSEDIWSFTGKAGQVIIISVRSKEIDTFVRLFGPDAIEIAQNDDGGDGTDSLLSVRLPIDGVYTAWVSSHSGAGKYTIRVFNAD